MNTPECPTPDSCAADAATLEAAADVIRRRTTKPNAIGPQAVIRALQKSAATLRNRPESNEHR